MLTLNILEKCSLKLSLKKKPFRLATINAFDVWFYKEYRDILFSYILVAVSTKITNPWPL